MSFETGQSRLRLRTIIRVRWLAIAGQVSAVLFVHYGLQFNLPLGWCFAAIAFSAWLNIYLRIKFPTSQHLKSHLAALLLGYDILQLTLLLFLTGGLQNPFSFLLVVPVTVSAATQLPRITIALAAFAIACATFIAFVYYPLPWYDRETLAQATLVLPDLYVYGIWVAIVLGLAFMSFYTWKVAEEGRLMSEALRATELVMAREQRLQALDGLAAAAAHELGTPLSTIVVVAKELERECTREGELKEDILLLKSQAQRCREIIAKLTSDRERTDLLHQRIELSGLLEEVVQPHRVFEKAINIDARPDHTVYPNSEAAREPVIFRHPGIIYGLGNIVENAVDFADSRVDVEAFWSAKEIRIRISDDGPGFAHNVMDQIGDPYVTTRPSTHDNDTEADEHVGMGLGFFIAKTFLERSGGKVDLRNKEHPQSGAIIEITWPREAIDAGTQA